MKNNQTLLVLGAICAIGVFIYSRTHNSSPPPQQIKEESTKEMPAEETSPKTEFPAQIPAAEVPASLPELRSTESPPEIKHVENTAQELNEDPKYLEQKKAGLEGAKKTVDSVANIEDAKLALNASANCVSQPDGFINTELQANCIITAQKILTKFPSLTAEFKSKLVESAKRDAMDLARKLDPEGFKDWP